MLLWSVRVDVTAVKPCFNAECVFKVLKYKYLFLHFFPPECIILKYTNVYRITTVTPSLILYKKI